MDNLKKLSLFIILDAYVTKNAIEDFILEEPTKMRENISRRNNIKTIDNRVKIYIEYLENELEEIEEFLNDSENIHWIILGLNREFFDKNLPRHKRRIQWFHSVDRYPFDYNIFLPSIVNNG